MASSMSCLTYKVMTYKVNGILKLCSARYRLYDVAVSSVKCVNV
jgi:hypothetical protein